MLPIIPWAGNFSILLLKCLDSRHADVAAGSDENNLEESEEAMSLERPGIYASLDKQKRQPRHETHLSLRNATASRIAMFVKEQTNEMDFHAVDAASGTTGLTPNVQMRRLATSPRLLDIVTWELSQTFDGYNPEMTTLPIPFEFGEEAEGAIGKYALTPVPEEHLFVRGQFRGILKLHLYLKNADVATSGHCAHNQDVGKLIKADIYVAYDTKQQQMRSGTRVAVEKDWHDSYAAGSDIAFIRIDRPFDNTQPMRFRDTPPTGCDYIAVCGYPLTDEGAKRMRYSFKGRQNWSYTSHQRLVHYDLDSSHGMSGGPVLNEENIVVAVHRGRYSWTSNCGVIVDTSCFNLICEFLRQQAQTVHT
ncbi:hypothetical protein S40293_08017 [Stachybotrys chartarum IBT 40293]|nr:hypothetical protein S40293_08017 [Stachybotrys chartarum IBT 40293]